MNKYVCAMTIGPIIDAISNADNAVKLWKESFMFSCLSKNICEELKKTVEKHKKGENYSKDENDSFSITGMELITPYFGDDTKKKIDKMCAKGVGVYHDHIIVILDVNEKEKYDDTMNSLNEYLSTVIREAKQKTIEYFYSKEDYKEYISKINRENKDKKNINFVDKRDELVEFFENYIYVKGYIEKYDEKEHNEANIKDCKSNETSKINNEANKTNEANEVKESNDKKTIALDMKKLSSPLDSLELEASGVYRYDYNKNYFLYCNDFLKDLINKKTKEKSGDYIKLSRDEMVLLLENEDLINNSNDGTDKNKDIKIKGVDDIAKNGVTSNLKYKNYFAFVQADGDNMGKLLAKNNNLLDLQAFSDTCGTYAYEAVNLVKSYGGVVFYAGGDDLMFLAPLKGALTKDTKKNIENMNTEDSEDADEQATKNANILDLLNQIGIVFKEKFADKFKNDKAIIEKCSLSFGVSLIYRKFPLYDAYDISHNLLNEAKDVKKTIFNPDDKTTGDKQNQADEIVEKNRCCVELIKHSGKKSKFTLDNISNKIDDDHHLLKLISDLISKPISEDKIDPNANAFKKEEKLLEKANQNYGSILSHIGTYRSMYEDGFRRSIELNSKEENANKDINLVANLNANLMHDLWDRYHDTMVKFDLIAKYLIANRQLSEKKIDGNNDTELHANDIVDEYVSIIRYCKFFVEEEVDND